MLVVKLSPVDHLEVHLGCGVVHTHDSVAESHQEVEAENNDENDDDDDGHGACGQYGFRAERTDHTETSLTGDNGRHDLGYPGEAEETHQVVVCDELEHRPVPMLEKVKYRIHIYEIIHRQSGNRPNLELSVNRK